MNDPRLIPFREYMRRSRPWWWWLNPWGYADALEIIQAEAFRAAAGPEAPPPTSDAVREAVTNGDAYTLIGHAEYLRKVHGEEDMPEFFDGLGRRLLAALAAPAPADAVREAAERLRQLLRPPVTMTPDGYAFFRVEDVETVLRALAAPPSTVTVPDDAAVREAAERLREKMQETYDDPRYMNVWATAQERLGPYTGPNWIAEAKALDTALRGVQKGEVG